MIDRSGFSHIAFSLLAVASAIVLSAACGGKVGSGDSATDGGTTTDGTGGACVNADAPACNKCPADDGPPPAASCIKGAWSCPQTKCAMPPCDGAREPDCECGTPSCGADGTWACPRSCACPTNLSNLEGKPCDVEGLSCGGENCTNPCNFCNILQCEYGVWQRLEAFPAPCDDDGGVIMYDAGAGG